MGCGTVYDEKGRYLTLALERLLTPLSLLPSLLVLKQVALEMCVLFLALLRILQNFTSRWSLEVLDLAL